MADWPIHDELCRYQSIESISIAPGSINTKSSYTELTSSLIFDVHMISIGLNSGQASSTILCDIAVGAAGSEVVIIPNLIFSLGGITNVSCFSGYYTIPFYIPTGARVSSRAQCTSTGTIRFDVYLYGGSSFLSQRCFEECIDLGVDLTNSRGTLVDPGGTAWTWGSYVELSASTTINAKGFMLGFGPAADYVRSTTSWLVSSGVGASGSEILFNRIRIGATGATDVPYPNASPLYPFNIPIGARIVGKSACGVSTVSDRYIDVIAYLFR